MHHQPVGDDADRTPFAHDRGFAEWNRVRGLGHLAFETVEVLVLAEDHRVVVADALDQQPLGVVRRARADDLEPGDVGEQRRQHLAVLGRGAKAGADHRADHDRGLGLAAEHVLELGGLVEDLVETDAHEVDEHQLGHRAHAAGRRADRRADVGAFAQRRVEQAVAMLGVKPFGDAEHAAPGVELAVAAGAADDVFA